MTRDEIIRMAREAGYAIRQFDGVDEVMDGDNYHIQTDEVEKFSALFAAAERERVAAWMIQRSYATGHGDTTEDLLKELDWQIDERIAAEREACAKVCEKYGYDHHCGITTDAIAAAIRARGQE